MTIQLPVKPLLTNAAWRGRRFSTPAKVKFENEMRYRLPKVFVPGAPFYRVVYQFHLVYFSITDWDGCVKVLQDCLVKRGIISDDRFIVDARVFKFPAKQDRIVIRIEGCALEAAP